MLSLIGANLAPLIGVLVLGWDAGVVVLLYWVENLVLGVYTILRIVFARVPVPLFHAGKLFAIPFFTLHFGGFCAVHGLFIMALFELGGGPGAVFAETSSFPACSSSSSCSGRSSEACGAILRRPSVGW